MKVAMIGTGLQARRRVPVLIGSRRDSLVFVASFSEQRAHDFAQAHGCTHWGDWRAAIDRKDVDAVIICTTPESHAEIAIAALRAGKHVLCEKPLSRTIAEGEAMVAAARETGRILKCGFNHRHHPALRDAKKIIDCGDLGKLIIGRCRYGICGRPEYAKEWRADAKKTAGGQLMELGIHAIDLFRWYFGEIREVFCMTGTQFFPIAPLEDNGMALFRTTAGAMCSLHSSLTEWKNLFSFEVVGEDGYLTVEGLGASYGAQRLLVGRRDYEAPFQDLVTEYRGGDRSWQLEWEEFVAAIEQNREPIGNGEDGLVALRVALLAYEAAAQNRPLVTGNSGP